MKRKYRYDTQYIYSHPTVYVTKKDRRYKEYVEFKERHGFSPDECWNLDETLVRFLLPRLRYFRNHTIGYPPELKTFEKWCEVLDSIIFSFEEYLLNEFVPSPETLKRTGLTMKQYRKKLHEGIVLFGKYWTSMWW